MRPKSIPRIPITNSDIVRIVRLLPIRRNSARSLTSSLRTYAIWSCSIRSCNSILVSEMLLPQTPQDCSESELTLPQLTHLLKWILFLESIRLEDAYLLIFFRVGQIPFFRGTRQSGPDIRQFASVYSRLRTAPSRSQKRVECSYGGRGEDPDRAPSAVAES